jgi:amidase
LTALSDNQRLARQEGIDAVMDSLKLDALIAPSGPPAWKIDPIVGENVTGGCTTPAALAGYPVITVPIGQAHGLPVGLGIMGRAFSEPTLLRIAYAVESIAPRRALPRYTW